MAEYRGKAHQAVYQAGRAARLAGAPVYRCPYDVHAVAVVGRGRHIPTGERGFARAWLKGWTDADAEQSR